MNEQQLYSQAYELKLELEARIGQWGLKKISKPIVYTVGYCKPFKDRFHEKLWSGKPSGALSLDVPEKVPLVSVITVCLNSEKHISRAIETVLGQTCDSFEYIIQDGGSTDKTRDIIREYQRTSRITLISEPDKATLDGMLKALKHCRGKYIAVCWADDELMPRALDWAIKRFAKSDADIIYGDQILYNRIANERLIYRGAPWDARRFLLNEFYPPFSSAFFKKELLVKLEKYLTVFDHDEYEFWLLLHALGKIQYMPGVVSVFNVHQDTRWMNTSATQYIARMCEGKRSAIGRLAKLGMLPDNKKQTQEEGANSVDLWAAIHMMNNSDDLESICHYIRAAMEHFNGDYRFVYLQRGLNAKLMQAYEKQLFSPEFI